ncbi:Mitochondrial inner membrane protein OXA1L [Dirofilaria immitis]
MSIYVIPYHIVIKRFGGIISSSSASIFENFVSTVKWRNVDNRRNFSVDTYSAVPTELQILPLPQWFKQSMEASCSYAQNLIKNSAPNSVLLEHLGLCTWWKPSSWYRVYLESLHSNYDLSWLSTIICATILIRMTTIYLPVLIYWKRMKFEKPQLPFLHQIRSRTGSILLYSSSVGLFLIQYCGIKKMAEAVYPGWTTCGKLSFTNLTISDPAFLLPVLTTICFTFTSKKWIETLQMQKTVSNWMLGLRPNNVIYPIAACLFFIVNNVPSIVCVYWITSSLISAVHATVFGTRTARSFLHLPGVYLDPAETRRIELLNYVSEMRRKKSNETMRVQKKIAEIEKKTQENDDLSKSLVKEAENIELEKDSLFREPWKHSTTLSSSKIAKLMEQRIKEATRENVTAKAEKSNLKKKTNRKFEIDEIIVVK